MAKATLLKHLNVHAGTAQNAYQIVRQRLEDLYSWSSYVDDPTNVHELHDMRIAAKRLRYTFEVFEEVLPASLTPMVDDLATLQDRLGELHDTDVMITLLKLCLGQDHTQIVKDQVQAIKQKNMLPTELMADLTDPAVAPDTLERDGLEHLLSSLQQERERRYQVARDYWCTLQQHNFRQRILDSLINS